MPSVWERRELTLVPEYRTVILQDARFDARVGASEAITEAGRNVAAAAPYELYLIVAQSQLPVRIELLAWDAPPEQEQRSPDGWTFVGAYRVPFPTGDVILGDGGGQSITGPWLRGRTGTYTVEVFSRGRDEATTRLRHILEETASMTIPEMTAYKNREGSGIEQYLLHLWPA
jgi:hypothetical protein